MRDDEGRSSSHDLLKRGNQISFGPNIERAGRLVENEKRSIFQKCARDGKALPLSAGEARASFADLGVVALRQSQNEFMGVSCSGCSNDLRAARIEAPVGNVVSNCGGKEYGLLADDGELLAQRRDAEAVQVNAVEQDAPAGGLVEPREQIDEGCLARSTLAHDANLCPCWDRDRHVIQCLGSRRIGERDVFEAYLSRNAIDRRMQSMALSQFGILLE